MKAHAWVGTAALVVLLGAAPPSWAQANAATLPDWAKVRRLAPGAEIEVSVKGRAPLICWFLRADDATLVVLEPVDGGAIRRIRSATSGLGDSWSRVARGGSVSIGDTRRVTVSPDAIVDGDTTLARRLEVARTDVTGVQNAGAGDQILRQSLVNEFDQLPAVLRPGDTVWVADTAGREVKGKLLNLSAVSISVQTGGNTREFPAQGVGRILVRGPNPLRNGALTGLIVGGGIIGGMVALSCAAGECSGEDAGPILTTIAMSAGIGAAIGVGIDAAIPGKKMLVYGARTSGAVSSVRFSPILGRGCQGVAVRISF